VGIAASRTEGLTSSLVPGGGCRVSAGKRLGLASNSVEMSDLSTTDVAQLASAAFTAVAAGAACLSVFRVERDRWRSKVPELHVEVLADVKADEMRLNVVNLGGPAREVRVMGVIGQFGFFGLLPPTSHWLPGEMRTIRLAMPVVHEETSYVFVEARDMAKDQLVIGTVGGAVYRWPLRKAKQLSAGEEWRRLFPGVPGPLDVPYSPVDLQLVDRHLT
jgi:hypothetical protein